MAKITDDDWALIRRHWELDVGEPTYLQAAERAAKEAGFEPPGKSSIDFRRKREGWIRRSNLTKVVAEAQKMADQICDAPEGAAQDSLDTVEPWSSERAEQKRAHILVRHRGETAPVRRLLGRATSLIEDFDQKALAKKGMTQDAISAAKKEAMADAEKVLKSAKLMAETISILQTAEQKSWGLNVVLDTTPFDQLSDRQLEAVAEGKAVKGEVWQAQAAGEEAAQDVTPKP